MRFELPFVILSNRLKCIRLNYTALHLKLRKVVRELVALSPRHPDSFTSQLCKYHGLELLLLDLELLLLAPLLAPSLPLPLLAPGPSLPVVV